MPRKKTATLTVPGAAPGIEHHEITSLPGGTGQARITCIDYCPTNLASQEITDIDDFVSKHRPEWSAVPGPQSRCRSGSDQTR